MAEKEQKTPQSAAAKPDDTPPVGAYDSKLVRRLAHYLRPYWIQATISTLAVSLTPTAYPLAWLLRM